MSTARFQTTLAKLKEPSTIRGIFLMLSVMGLNIPDSFAEPVGLVVVGGIAIYEMLRDE